MDVNLKTPTGDFTLRAAALIIEHNQLLAIQHDKLDCVYTIGGAIKANETSADAAIREAYEETGHLFTINRVAFIQERFYHTGNTSHHEVVFFYLMNPTDAHIEDGTCTDHPEETLHWFPMDRLQNINLVPAFLKTALTDFPSEVVHVISEE